MSHNVLLYISQRHRLKWFSLLFSSFNLDFSLQKVQSILASRFFCQLVLSFPAMLVKTFSGFKNHATVWKYAFSSALSIYFRKIFVHFTAIKLFSKRNKWQETTDKQDLVLVLPEIWRKKVFQRLLQPDTLTVFRNMYWPFFFHFSPFVYRYYLFLLWEKIMIVSHEICGKTNLNHNITITLNLHLQHKVLTAI